MQERELEAMSGAVALAGSLHLPDAAARGCVLMHPGSGPSNRWNDGYFDQIRDHLVEHGVAVAAFDKRGVGGSTGRWEDAGIVAQADDALAALDVVRRVPELGGVPIGLFGHSQGGWVVIEAASRETVSFVICNSGPGVTPAQQERFALISSLPAGDDPAPHLAKFDRGLALARAGAPFHAVMMYADDLDPYVPEDEASWEFWVGMLDHDPRPALEQLRVPVLAVFGVDDRIVPVLQSVEVFAHAVDEGLLTLAVIPGANHRLQRGDPPRLAEGYLDVLTDFLDGCLA